MDLDERKKRQAFKVLLVEALMSIAVVVTVVILVLIVSGYGISSDFKIERFGFLKINSEPSGATVIIDGEDTHDKTGYSRVVTSAEHEILLEKEGYDSWRKTVKITEGLLYQVRYPRLFLQDRAKEHAMDLKDIAFVSVSPDYGEMFLQDKDNQWFLLNLRDEKLAKKPIDALIKKTEDQSNIKLLSMDWSKKGKRALLKASINDVKHWYYIDFEDSKNNFDFAEQFGIEFEKIAMLDDSANELLVYKDKKIRKIDTVRRLMSDALMSNVNYFYPFMNGNIIVVSAGNGKEKSEEKAEQQVEKKYVVSVLSSSETKELLTFDENVKVSAIGFYDDRYLIVYSNNSLSVYKGGSLEPVFTEAISVDLNNLQIIDGEGFVVARDGSTINALDMEAMQLNVWKLEKDDKKADGFGWIDRGLIYAIYDGVLRVYDFDGQNERELSTGVSANMPVFITGNKWLYYFSDGALMREWLIKR
jgi:hypothetical protein